MFDPNIFWSAFARAGMLVEVVYQPDAGPAVPFQAGFKRPDQVVLDGIVHSTDYSIEYKSADVELKRGSGVTIAGEGQFTVRNPPMAQGDGAFVIATLEKVST